MEQMRVIDTYISEVQQELHDPTSAEPYLTALREDLTDHFLKFPDATLEDLINQFGTPKITAKDFLNHMEAASPKELTHKIKKCKRIIISLSILLKPKRIAN